MEDADRQARTARATHLEQLLFAPGTAVFALLDAARDTGVPKLLETGDCPYACLYTRQAAATYRAYAPYLVQLSRGTRVLHTLLTLAWGHGIGYFVGTHSNGEALATHLRKFLFVDLPHTGRKAYFRFYDPRVMRSFLPTCTGEQLDDLLRDQVAWLLMEDPDAGHAQSFISVPLPQRQALHTEARLSFSRIRLATAAPRVQRTSHEDPRLAV
jgi:hypothetical protein